MTKLNAMILAAALAATPSVALAGSYTCSAGWGDGFCHTSNIHANAEFHFVNVSVSGPCELFTVIDRANGITVSQGSSGWGGTQRTIGGLYSDYSVYLYGGTWPITSVTISN